MTITSNPSSSTNSILMSMSEAIAKLTCDGSSIVMGSGMEQNIPFSAGHELIRQRRRELTLIGPISDILFDQLIGAGCVKKVCAAWVGNVMMGSAYNFRRSVEQGVPNKIEVVDYSNFAMACALHAAALGIPYMPMRSLLGTDILKNNPNLIEIESPFESHESQAPEKLSAVRALHPDLAIIHAQRADVHGSAHIWGGLGVVADSAKAAKRTLIVADEIVETSVIESDPNRTVVPGFLVDAVVCEPYAAHPSPSQGKYNRDHQHYTEYHAETKTHDGFLDWKKRWILDVPDRAGYRRLLGDARLLDLSVGESAYAAETDFGY